MKISCPRAFAAFLIIILSAFAAPFALAQDGGAPAETQALIDILENDEKRAALIEQLKAAAKPPVKASTPEAPSLGRQIAEFTKGAAEQAAASFTAAQAAVLRAPEAFSTLNAEQLDLLIEALKALALVIIATTAIYMALRFWSKRVFRSMGDSIVGAGFGRTLAMVVLTTVMDIFIVLIAWGAGYLIALAFYGEAGEIGVRQSLYLNAFLIVGMVKVVLRAVIAPSSAELRFVGISDVAARRLSRWLGMIAAVLGYGQLLIVPIVNQQASLEAGRGASTLLALVAILIAAGLVIRGRRPAAAWLIGEDPDDKPGLIRFVARNWHLPVLVYLFSLFLIVAARPDGLIWPVLINSAQVIGVVVAGFVISGAITRSIQHGVHVPAGVSSRLPMLERRLNTFVPKVLMVLRALILFGVVLFALNALDLIDLWALLEGEFGASVTAAMATIFGILFIAFAIWLALTSWIDFRLNPDFGSAPTAREQTLLSLLKNAATVVLIVITTMFVLSELGVDIAPLIASAGVLGLAIGFGAQKMVQDIITGIFIQFENAMNVGDFVTLGGTSGTVEKLTIRSVSLRDTHGVFHIIPFSSVDMVSNYVKDYGNFVCDMGIGYRENVGDAKAAMHDAFDELKTDWAQHIMGDLQWFGLLTLGDSAVVLRARIKCMPGQQWAVGRAYNEICKRIFDERDIEIPFPHQTIYFGVDKKGEAPPLHLKSEAVEKD